MYQEQEYEGCHCGLNAESSDKILYDRNSYDGTYPRYKKKLRNKAKHLDNELQTDFWLQNNVTELFSLIHFLRIKPYCEADRFSRDFTRPLKCSSDNAKTKAMRQLQALLKAILLRRTKKSQIDGKPILNLPERTTEPAHAAFNQDERDFYSALESRTQLQFNKYLKAGTVGRNYSNILVLLLRLRQACCHPHLIKDFAQATGVTDVSADDMKELAKQLAPDVIARIKEQSGQNEDAALECPVCMDLAENATICK